jgi:hypothetical protein
MGLYATVQKLNHWAHYMDLPPDSSTASQGIRNIMSQLYVLLAGYLFGLFFDLKNAGSTFLQNVGGLPSDTIWHRIPGNSTLLPNSSDSQCL